VLVASGATLGTLGLAAVPASGVTQPSLTAHLATGSPSDFSYTSTGAQMARNVVVSAQGFPAGNTIDFDESACFNLHTPLQTCQDLPDESAQADSTGSAQLTIGGIPASDCGSFVEIAASGISSAAFAGGGVVDNCGPMLSVTHAAFSMTVFGDGFTPGGQVKIDASFVGYPTTSQTVTATTERTLVRCGPVGFPPVYRCVSSVLTPPGQFSVTIPTPCPSTGNLVDSVTATDLSTQQKTVDSEVVQPSCPQLPPGAGL
jgi:hypothetical protein